jgi:hypothetical protein
MVEEKNDIIFVEFFVDLEFKDYPQAITKGILQWSIHLVDGVYDLAKFLLIHDMRKGILEVFSLFQISDKLNHNIESGMDCR